MIDDVAELASRCVVTVYRGGTFLGSGFLAAPGAVLTCAHVAAKCPQESMMVHWGDHELPVLSTQLIPPGKGNGPTWAPPDLGLLTVEGPSGHPFAWLAERAPPIGATVVSLGYSTHTPAEGLAPDSVLLDVAGASGHGLLRVQQGEIAGGMSGSLVLDLDTGRVCGMVKASQDPQAVRGGWIIPAPVIAANLPGIAEASTAGHPPGSAWRDLATRRADFARRLFNSAAPLRIPDPPPSTPPSWWLDPRHRATGFQERPELQTLLAWANDPDPAAPLARLVTGEGGAGKTRLALELAMRLGADGWIAGLLTTDDEWRLPSITETLHEAVAHGHRIFLAMDYVEGLGKKLTDFLGQVPGPDQGTVRILMLARFGGWWNDVTPSGSNKYLISREPVGLGPLAPNPDTAEARFSEALHDYRRRMPGSGPGSAGAPPAGLIEAARQHAAAIKIHALAVVSVLHERNRGTPPYEEVTWADPLTMLVGHERKHWREAARGRLGPHAGDRQMDGRILVTPTLFPAYRETEAQAAIARVPGLAERVPREPAAVAELLRDLYPPQDTTTLRWWSPLPLDRLGETLLGEVLADSTDSPAGADYVISLLAAASLPQTVQGLTVITRLGADPQVSAVLAARIRYCLDMLATADRSRLLPALLLADRQVAPEHRAGQRHLAALSASDTLSLVQQLERAPRHRLLQETGLVLLDHAGRLLAQARADSLLPPLRELLDELAGQGIEVPINSPADIYLDASRAKLLNELGRAGEAVTLAERAAGSMRTAFQASIAGEAAGAGTVVIGDSVVANVADAADLHSLFLYVFDVYAGTLETVARLEESAQARQEAAELAASMAVSGDPQAARTAAFHLYKLGGILNALGRAEEAEPRLCEADGYLRELPLSPLTAQARTLHAIVLDKLGRTDEARAAAVHALQLHRDSADSTGSYVLLADAQSSLGHLLPEAAGSQGALEALRVAAQRDPAFVTPQLVTASMQQAQRLAEQGDREAARRHLDEAVTLSRRLAADDPDTYLRSLAFVLVQGAQAGLYADPLSVTAEATAIMRRLVDRYGRSELRPELALTVIQHSVHLRDEERDAEALEGFAQAVDLLRASLEDDRWRTTPYLTSALGLFSETACEHGDLEQAVAAAREAIELDAARTDDLPPAPATQIVRHRRTLLAALAKLMTLHTAQGPELVQAASAVVTEARMLARNAPAGTLTDHDTIMFASALVGIGMSFRDAGRAEDALLPLDEAAGLLRAHAEAHPAGGPAAMLLLTSTTRVTAYREAGRHRETAAAAAELLTDCRRPLPGAEEERRNGLRWAADIMQSLPCPEFARDALHLAVELSRTCREIPGLGAEGPAFLSRAVHEIRKLLRYAPHGDFSGGESQAAIREIGAGVRFLTETAPGFLDSGHVEGLMLCATILAAGDELDCALQMNTQAVELSRSLSATSAGQGEAADADASILQGLILLSRDGDEVAVPVLEQALAALVAGPGLSGHDLELCRAAVAGLTGAYKRLGREADLQVLTTALDDAGLASDDPPASEVPLSGGRLTGQQGGRDAAVTDPGRAIAGLEEVMDAAAASGDFAAAHEACQALAAALQQAGRLSEALRLADLQIGHGLRAGAGQWTQLSDKAQRLYARQRAGADDQAVLAEADSLLAAAKRIREEPAGRDRAKPWQVRELLYRIAGRAASSAGQWPVALRNAHAEVRSVRERGGSPAETALAEITRIRVLAATGRAREARDLLGPCAAAFQDERNPHHLGLGKVRAARAGLAALDGDLRGAAEQQSSALGWFYLSGDVVCIQEAHSSLGTLLQQADQYSGAALAHHLAAGVLAELVTRPPDIEQISTALVFRGGDFPATLDLLEAAVDATPGARWGELIARLSGDGAMVPQHALRRLAQQASSCHPGMFRDLARQRMQWDPVFAGIAVARAGNIAAAQAVRQQLSGHRQDPEGTGLHHAVEHVFYQRYVQAASVPLDVVDQIMLRRCLDALDGSAQITAALVEAIPLAGFLSELLKTIQDGGTGSQIRRNLENVVTQGRWQPLAGPLRGILAGRRDTDLAAGLDPACAAVVSALLAHLSPP